MRTLKLLVVLMATLSTFANTKTIECETFYQVEWDFTIDLKVTGEITKEGHNKYILKNRTMDFKVDTDWYEFTGKTTEELGNIENYNPRKYKGYIKFDYVRNLSGMEGDHPAPYGVFGSIDFLLPTAQLDNAQSGDEFEAITIFSWISDHWGGTRTLKCHVK
jgi:hypothetical protein